MCGLYGMVNYSNKMNSNDLNEIINALARESAERGSDATGEAHVSNGRLIINKAPKSAYKMRFSIPKGTPVAMGHTRHATNGSPKDNFNNHPWLGVAGKQKFVLAHNGILYNDISLRKQLKLPKTKVLTDSFIAVQLLERAGELSHKSMKEMAEQVEGSFTFTVLDDRNNFWAIKGDSPLSILHFKSLSLYVYASTDQILYRAITQTILLKHLKSAMCKNDVVEDIEVTDGSIICINSKGIITTSEFKYDEYGSFGYSWWDWDISSSKIRGCSNLPPIRKTDDSNDVQEYLDMLRILATECNYNPDDVNRLYADGFTLTEIEELLYDDGLAEYYSDDDTEENDYGFAH